MTKTKVRTNIVSYLQYFCIESEDFECFNCFKAVYLVQNVI